MKLNYNLDFYQALKAVIEGGTVRGENFQKNLVMKLGSKGQLIICDLGGEKQDDDRVYLGTIYSQKFANIAKDILQALIEEKSEDPESNQDITSSKDKKYEFTFIEGDVGKINSQLERLQNDGWVVAGEVASRYSKDGDWGRMLIPIKRQKPWVK